jgi:hypothetical protein
VRFKTWKSRLVRPASGFVPQEIRPEKRHAGAFGSNEPDTSREEKTSKGVKKPRSAVGMK